MMLQVVCFFIGVHIISISANQPLRSFDHSVNLTALELTFIKKFSDENENNYIKKAASNFDQCTKTIFDPAPPHPIENHEKFCQYFNQKEIFVCIKYAMIDLLPALTETEMYLPYYFLNAYHFGYEELCGAEGFSNTEYLYNTLHGANSNRCISEIPFHIYFEGTCLSGLNIFKDLEKGILNIRKKDLCSDLESVQRCVVQLAERECKDDFSRLFDLIFRPFTEECNSLHDQSEFN